MFTQPFPVSRYPNRHWQTYEPSVSTHVDFSVQLTERSEHSSMFTQPSGVPRSSYPTCDRTYLYTTSMFNTSWLMMDAGLKLMLCFKWVFDNFYKGHLT